MTLLALLINVAFAAVGAMASIVLGLAHFRPQEELRTGSRGVVGLLAAMGGLEMSASNVKEWLQLLSLAAGFMVAIVTVVSVILQMRERLRSSRQEARLREVEMDRTQQLLCEACMATHQPPPHCPIEPAARPVNCILRVLEGARNKIDRSRQS